MNPAGISMYPTFLKERDRTPGDSNLWSLSYNKFWYHMYYEFKMSAPGSIDWYGEALSQGPVTLIGFHELWCKDYLQ